MHYHSIKVIEPNQWPISVEDLKAWCRVTADYEDSIFESLRASAVEYFERSTNTRLRVEEGLIDRPVSGGLAWTLPSPLRAVIGAQVLVRGAWKELAPAELTALAPTWQPLTCLGSGPPTPGAERVRVRVVVGHGDWLVPKHGFPYEFPFVFGADRLPGGVQHPGTEIVQTDGVEYSRIPVKETALQALRMLVAHWFENREAEVTGTITKQVEIGLQRLVDLNRPVLYG